MININLKGIFIEENILFDYKKYNINSEELLFYIQINYISNQGEINFESKLFASKLGVSEQELFSKLNSLYNKKLIKINNQGKIIFLLNNKDNYFTLKELIKFVEKIINKIMTSKELDIVSSWIENKFTKKEIEEAFSISKNIAYVNGILNNKPIEISNELDEDDILSYDWIDK